MFLSNNQYLHNHKISKPPKYPQNHSKNNQYTFNTPSKYDKQVLQTNNNFNNIEQSKYNKNKFHTESSK